MDSHGEPRASRPVMLAIVAGVALSASAGLAQIGQTHTAASSPDAASRASTTSLAGLVSEESEYNYGNNNCSDYDDDLVYTSDVCGSYDAGSCANNCKGGGWCSYFCMNSTTSKTDFGCDTGSGAICAMKTLADLEATCQVVQSMNYTSKPDKWVNAHGVPDRSVVPTDEGEGEHSDVHPSMHRELEAERIARNSSEVDNEGCDEHVFCEFCDEDCQNIMDHKAVKLWGKAKYEYWYRTSGVGPFSMELLQDIVDLCKLEYPDGVDMARSDDSAELTAVTTTHEHTESCGKGCTEKMYDDDTVYETVSSKNPAIGSGTGDGFKKSVVGTGHGDGLEKTGSNSASASTDAPAPEDVDAASTDADTEETEEEERAAHTDANGHPIVSSPNWATSEKTTTVTASPQDVDASSTDADTEETEETEEAERAAHTDADGHPIVSSPNWATGEATTKTETASPMDPTGSSETTTADALRGDKAGTEPGQVTPDGTAVGKPAGSGNGDGMEKSSEGVSASTDDSSESTAVTTQHAHSESCGKGCTEYYYDDDTTYTASPNDAEEEEQDAEAERAAHTDAEGHPVISSPHWASSATSMAAAAGLPGGAGSDVAALGVAGAAVVLVVAGVVTLRRRQWPSSYEPI